MEQNFMLYVGAMTLGALHAFEPGHGKTLIAAYMIGTRGRALDGVLLGLIVTFTHTFSVLLLGVAAKVLSRTYSESEIHAWLGLFSSVLILIVGLWMLRQRLTGNGPGHIHPFAGNHDHPHDHGNDHRHHHAAHTHSHSREVHDIHVENGHEHTSYHTHHHHHDHTHDHSGTGRAAEHGGRPNCHYNMWNLLLLGVSGGLVPCPAAIATLLAAIAAGRIAEGLTMAIFFSVGLGLVMMSIGVILAHAGKFTERIGENMEFARRMGVASALIITILGAYTFYHSVTSLV